MILPYRGAPRRVKNVEHITCPGCGWLFPPGAAEQGRCLSCGLTSLWHAPELQSERGKASGSHGARRPDRDAEIRRLHGQGEPKRKIARSGVSAKMVRKVLDRRGGPNHAHARAQAREAWGGMNHARAFESESEARKLEMLNLAGSNVAVVKASPPIPYA